jgi:dTDP-4-amino-4,6-dideoxygalactose transaminase
VKDDFTQGWPVFDDDEIAAVERVLRSGRVNYWTGTETRDFEQAFAKYIGSDYAVALANGTVALELALRSLGIGPGDDVIVTSRSFVASASAVSLCGASPVFADVDPVSQNVTADTIEDVITASTRAVLVVHLGGWPCDMAPIIELADEQGLVVIEDCAQALGSSIGGRSVGTWGHVAAWSFCQDKIMTTGGEGGMLTTNDPKIFNRAWSYKDHGKNLEKLEGTSPGPSFKWVHDSIGTNWRMTEIQAAIGNVALPKVAGWVEHRRALAAVLDEYFSSHEAFRTTVPGDDMRHVYYKYYVFVRPERLPAGVSRDSLLEALHERDVPAYTGICGEIYREEAFEDSGFAPDDRHVNAKELSETAIMIPIHPNLSDRAVLDVARAIVDTLRQLGG